MFSDYEIDFGRAISLKIRFFINLLYIVVIKLSMGGFMNEIDNKFFELIEIFKNLSEEQLYERIKLNYQSLPSLLKDIYEDYFQRFDYWGSLNEKNNDFEEIKKKAHILSKYYKDFVWLYNKLEDYSSKYLLFAILNNWFIYDITNIKKCIDNKYKHYFDLDIIPKSEKETFVDVGAYVGDSSLDYIKTYGKKDNKIYCYEITNEMIEIMKNNLKDYENIEYVNKAVKDKIGKVFIDEKGDMSSNQTSVKGNKQIVCTTLDEDIKERIDIIKMDIEGDELSALKGAKRHIINDSPKLLISIYHKNEHYIKIPRYIYSLNKNYNFYMRYYGGELYPTEVVLLAIPKRTSKFKR